MLYEPSMQEPQLKSLIDGERGKQDFYIPLELVDGIEPPTC